MKIEPGTRVLDTELAYCSDSLTVMLPSATLADGLAQVVQMLNSTIHGINHFSADMIYKIENPIALPTG